MTTQRGNFRRLHFFGAVLSLVALTSFSACSSSKKKGAMDDGGIPNAASADENQGGHSDSGNAMGLQTVHFPYDNSKLDPEAKNILKANAQILKDKPSLKIQIEGHCDQRGGIQYNIALGERRANAARKYLQDLGIKSDRITVISFGKERPIDSGTAEDSYARNRRDNFVITSQ